MKMWSKVKGIYLWSSLSQNRFSTWSERSCTIFSSRKIATQICKTGSVLHIIIDYVLVDVPFKVSSQKMWDGNRSKMLNTDTAVDKFLKISRASSSHILPISTFLTQQLILSWKITITIQHLCRRKRDIILKRMTTIGSLASFHQVILYLQVASSMKSGRTTARKLPASRMRITVYNSICLSLRRPVQMPTHVPEKSPRTITYLCIMDMSAVTDYVTSRWAISRLLELHWKSSWLCDNYVPMICFVYESLGQEWYYRAYLLSIQLSFYDEQVA